ncbi:MAG: DUF1684 domain-containing protein [Bernardetiaceae bacterium]|jgi:hypothetical protein|nr:DUF1684 domain-containing protein [Bernardetiaceae bacterium]
MSARYLLFAGIAVVLLLIGFYSFSDLDNHQQYVDKIAMQRADKDQLFKSDDDSPIAEADRPSFAGLAYFAADESYRVEAQLEMLQDSQAIEMPTTTGETRKLKRFAKATFQLGGEPHTLVLFHYEDGGDEEALFLPFADRTNGQQTYEMGRYLDIAKANLKGGRVIIDFNLAYNPYCAYSEEYSCPVPPPENRLKISILAGEKSFKKKNS